MPTHPIRLPRQHRRPCRPLLPVPNGYTAFLTANPAIAALAGFCSGVEASASAAEDETLNSAGWRLDLPQLYLPLWCQLNLGLSFSAI
jgi:hypothetical protein